jgi:hypothetical protein
MLLALSISSIESIQAFIFYTTQYSLRRLKLLIVALRGIKYKRKEVVVKVMV